MKLTVRNFLGVSALNLDLAGVTLVAGVNGAGKSAIIEAAACAATSSPLARGIATKKAGSESILREGSEAGAIALSDERAGWARRIDYPDCSVRERGSVPPLGSRLALGLDRFGALGRKERAAALGPIFGLNPTEDDFMQALSEVHDGSASDAKTLWQRIEANGWDAVARSAREDGAKLKGKWEHVTGRRYGVDVARTWCPAGIDPAEQHDLTAAQAAAAEALQALEQALAAGGSAHGERARLQDIADREGVRAANVHDMRKAIAEDDRTLASLRDRLVAAEREAREAAPLECPHCHQPVRLSSTANSIPVLTAASVRAAVDPKESARAIAAIRQDGAALRTARDGRASALAKAEAQLVDAVAAREKLAAMPDDAEPGVDVESARADLARCEALAAGIAAHAEATDLARQITQSTALIAILDPGGLRAECAASGVGAVNDALGLMAISTGTHGWRKAEITADLEILYAGRSYQLCSESERWRADLMMQCAVAKEEGAALTLADRLDVLAPQDRGSAIQLLAAMQIPAIIACTAKDASAVPDLARLGIGRTVWLESGGAQKQKGKRHDPDTSNRLRGPRPDTAAPRERDH